MNNEKFTSQKGELQLIENKDMDCKDCILKYSHSDIECIKYMQKPLSVIRGGSCSFKKASKNM